MEKQTYKTETTIRHDGCVIEVENIKIVAGMVVDYTIRLIRCRHQQHPLIDYIAGLNMNELIFKNIKN